MSNQIKEEAKWRIGKSEIISKYRQDHEKLFSVVAARGFTTLPGFAYDMENKIGLSARINLSELNMKLLTETVEREIKQSGIDYDLSYRAAAIAWEIDKQALLDAWQREYSSIKANMAHAEEVLDLLMVEVRARNSYLIEQKTAIEVEAEELKQQLATLDASTAAYDVLLANAKLATATKKLELIPILLEIVEKEEELLEAEQGKAEEYAKLIEAEQAVADKKEQLLVPKLTELASVSERYTEELPTQIQLEKDIVDEKVDQMTVQVEIAGIKKEIAEIQLDIEEENLEQERLKLELQEARLARELELLEKRYEQLQAFNDAEMAADATMISNENSTNAIVLSKKSSTVDKRIETEKTSSTTMTTAEQEKINSIAISDSYRISQEAAAQAARNITASLTHLIG